jgi:hypothetical protein
MRAPSGFRKNQARKRRNASAAVPKWRACYSERSAATEEIRCEGTLAKADRRLSDFYRITSMRTLPVLPMPMARAAPLLKSIARPFTNGPRSLIRTMMERPLREFVTRTRVPKGSVRRAAVIAPGTSHRMPFVVLKTLDHSKWQARPGRHPSRQMSSLHPPIDSNH